MAENYQSVFERYEKKYLLSREQYEALLPRLREIAAPDAYGETTVMNLYYDTPDYRVIRRSLEKPKYKEKLRIRCYGVPGEGSQAFLELKKKCLGIVYKRRIAMPYGEAVRHIDESVSLAETGQIGAEIDYYRSMYPGLERGMVIIYERTAYAGVRDPELRITFDEGIRYRERGKLCDLTGGSGGTTLLKDGERIMEIKVPRAMPLELVHLLNELKIYPHTFSKYGQAYKVRFRKEGSAAGKWVEGPAERAAAVRKPAEEAKPAAEVKKPAEEAKPAAKTEEDGRAQRLADAVRRAQHLVRVTETGNEQSGADTGLPGKEVDNG